MMRTVTGDIEPPPGRFLVHEHLRIDLTSTKGPDTVLGTAEEADVIADLRRTASEHGLDLVGDLSVPGSGRDHLALRHVSKKAGVAVVAATGFYWDPLPPEANASIANLRDRMVAEIVKGVEGT